MFSNKFYLRVFIAATKAIWAVQHRSIKLPTFQEQKHLTDEEANALQCVPKLFLSLTIQPRSRLPESRLRYYMQFPYFCIWANILRQIPHNMSTLVSEYQGIPVNRGLQYRANLQLIKVYILLPFNSPQFTSNHWNYMNSPEFCTEGKPTGNL